MSYEQYVSVVLSPYRTASEYAETVIDNDRDDDGYLEAVSPEQLEERLSDAFADAFSDADHETRLGLLRHGLPSFARLCTQVERAVRKLPICGLSDRERHAAGF